MKGIDVSALRLQRADITNKLKLVEEFDDKGKLDLDLFVKLSPMERQSFLSDLRDVHPTGLGLPMDEQLLWLLDASGYKLLGKSENGSYIYIGKADQTRAFDCYRILQLKGRLILTNIEKCYTTEK